MRMIWYRMSVGRRVIVLVVATLIITSLGITAIGWLTAPHGSDAFNAGMTWGRLLAQLGAGIALIALLAIASRPKKRN
ncbi:MULTISPECIES: hypothetical protein [Arthrobacter]|uniref:hypothetical protein n=1 Tax=Arthrobacter TaxID=1663 RepID=UPI003397FA30